MVGHLVEYQCSVRTRREEGIVLILICDIYRKTWPAFVRDIRSGSQHLWQIDAKKLFEIRGQWMEVKRYIYFIYRNLV